jgi:Trypsin-like peptidase domain
MINRKYKLVLPENNQHHKNLFYLLVLVGVFFIVDVVQATTGSKNSSISIDSLCLKIEDRQDKVKGAKQICETSVKYVVKIRGSSDSLVSSSQGSGVIIKKIPDRSQPQLYKYYVLTNKHVLKDMQTELSIVTSDRDSHPVRIDKNNPVVSEQFDLGVVYFISKKEYQAAKIDKQFTSSLEGKESQTDIFVVGYPSCKETNCQDPKFTQGKYGPRKNLLNTNRLVKGYSIPYNNDTEGGMSGSPIITRSGTVIGIHGKGKYGGKSSRSDTPDAYVLENKAHLSPDVEELMKYFSWGIPIDLANDIIPSDSNETPKQESSSTSPTTSQPPPPLSSDIFSSIKNPKIGVTLLVIVGSLLLFYFSKFINIRSVRSNFEHFWFNLISKRNNKIDLNSSDTNPRLSASSEKQTPEEDATTALKENTEIMKTHIKVLQECINITRTHENTVANMNIKIARLLERLEKK